MSHTKKTNAAKAASRTDEQAAWPDFASLGQSWLEATQDEEISKLSRLPPALYLVATPIGNMGDITLRGLWALSRADAVFCEDTRVTGGLLRRFGLRTPLVSCHDHNEAARTADLLARLEAGQSVAFVSDAGTPLLSDPGFRLVRAAREAGHPVFALPGASALLTALVSSGLPAETFLFVGFLPSKAGARRAALAPLAKEEAALVFYESPRRIAATLAEMRDTLGPSRQAAVARELTKYYEEHRAGSLGSLAEHYAQSEPPKGEIVIVVAGGGGAAPHGPDAAGGATPADREAAMGKALKEALKTMSVKDAATAVAATLGMKRKDVYDFALRLRGD